jgi:hypothetical protein
MTHRMTDEEYDDWLRGVEETAAAKEEDTSDIERAERVVAAFLANDPKYGPAAIGGKISRRDLHEMLTRSGMLGTDTFPRSDFLSDYKHSPWSSDKDSDHRRSAGKD